MSEPRNAPHAPYNFVPFHSKNSSGANAGSGKSRVERVLIRYDSAEDLPPHDRIDPALKTGEIHVTMTAETPVFVSDGNEHFFRGANGRLMLPGSTIRGMVRENMQILGFGLVRPGEDLEDHQIYFREMAAARESAANLLKQYYREVLGVETGKDAAGKSFSIPKKVKAGYLRREGGELFIQPVRGSYLRVPRSHPALKKIGLSEGEAKAVPVAYIAEDQRVKELRRSTDPAPGLERGMLLYTGKAVGNKPNARYLFPAADENAPRESISQEDELSYRMDLEARRNLLKAHCEDKDQLLWELPGEGDEKPVFYVLHNGHTYFGMSLFLRIGYRHALSEGLPGPQAERRAESTPLDYIHAVLGFSEKERSYRSRVSFGDFAALGEPQEGEPVKAILSGPKPSWYPGYVVNGEHYNADEFYLRGFKLYWQKDVKVPPPSADKEKVVSTLRPLPVGTAFRGVIRYKNLHEDELGLLLWALRLEEGCCQSIGMGKPYGFGRMKLTIDSLREYDMKALYQPEGLCGGPAAVDGGQVAQYIQAYDAWACERLHVKKPKEAPSIRSQDAIRDFFFLRKPIRGEWNVDYMELEEYKNLAALLPDVKTMREEAERSEAQAAQIAEDPYEALRRKFGKL